MIIVRQVVYIELHTVASFVYFCFFEDGERVFWPLFMGIMANIWDYFWLFRPLGLGDLGLQHQFFLLQQFLMKVLSSTSLSFIQVSSPNFRDTMLHNFFQRCWLLQYFQSKNFFILDDITTSVWTWKFSSPKLHTEFWARKSQTHK